jgi:hypothetical protein
VCKHYLCGLCPYTLFNATKSDLGKCPKSICDTPEANTLRSKYNSLSQYDKDKCGYEYELMLFLKDLIHQCDQRVLRNKQRAEKEMQVTDEILSILGFQKLSVILTFEKLMGRYCWIDSCARVVFWKNIAVNNMMQATMKRLHIKNP